MSESTDSLSNTTALVTGAGGGVGRGIALALGAAGCKVVIAARRGATGEQTAEAIRAEGGQATAIETDVRRRETVERAVTCAVQTFGGLDIVVHNAASGLSGNPVALDAISEAMWDEQADVALAAAFYCARAAFPWLGRSGNARFVLLGSAFGLHGAGMNPAYAAVKSATRGFVKALAREWGPHGITVNAIAPSALSEAAAAYFEQNPAAKAQYVNAIPLRRLGRPREDIGEAVVGLCGPRFGYVTGQTLMVDGGLFTAL